MQVRGSCLWWQPERDGWEEGPKVKIIMRMRMISMTLRKMMKRMIMLRTTMLRMIILGMMMIKKMLKSFR